MCLLVVSGLFFATGYGQTIQYGVEGGINVSGARATAPGVVFHGTPGLRFAIGGYADIALKDTMFSIRPKLFFSREAYTPNIFGDKTPFNIADLPFHAGRQKNLFWSGPLLRLWDIGELCIPGYGDEDCLGQQPEHG